MFQRKGGGEGAIKQPCKMPYMNVSLPKGNEKCVTPFQSRRALLAAGMFSNLEQVSVHPRLSEVISSLQHHTLNSTILSDIFYG